MKGMIGAEAIDIILYGPNYPRRHLPLPIIAALTLRIQDTSDEGFEKGPPEKSYRC